MFCRNCAKEVKPELHYCNSCGFRLERTGASRERSVVGNLATGAGFIGVAGLVGFIFLLRIMLESRLESPAIVVISIVFLGSVFGLCAYTLSFIKYFRKNELREQSVSEPEAAQFSPRNTNQLEPPKQQPASVIENTTRTLDKVPIERK